MPIYVYRCDDGHRFERLVALDAAAPDCPECGGSTRKLPAGPRLGGRAGGAGSTGRTPIPWRGVAAGGPEKLQREVAFRRRLAATGTPEDDTGAATAPEAPGGDGGR